MSLTVLMLGEENPVNHVLNRGFKLGDLFGMHDVWLWSSHVGNLVLSGLITIALLWWASTKIKTGPESMGHARYVTKNPIAHTIEVICVYLRDETARPMLGARTDTFMPFLWTVFFFILINNLMGLLPINDVLHLGDQLTHRPLVGLAGATATGNPWVTGAMAIIAALVFNVAGIRQLGLLGYLKHLTAGTSWVLWPLMIPIEIMGTIIKPVALVHSSVCEYDGGAHPDCGAVYVRRERDRDADQGGRGRRRPGRHHLPGFSGVGGSDLLPGAVRGVPAGVCVHVPDRSICRAAQP